jgi:hypothetical protein
MGIGPICLPEITSEIRHMDPTMRGARTLWDEQLTDLVSDQSNLNEIVAAVTTGYGPRRLADILWV